MTAMRKVLTMLTVVLPALALMFFAVPTSVFAEGDGDTVTRAEWMSALESAYELNENDISQLPEDFSFWPDDSATREFAATTVNYFIGYETNQGQSYSFSDAGDMYGKDSKDSAEYVVRKGLLE